MSAHWPAAFVLLFLPAARRTKQVHAGIPFICAIRPRAPPPAAEKTFFTAKKRCRREEQSVDWGITGRIHQLGGTTAVEVSWGPQEREFVPEPLLKLFPGQSATIESKIAAGDMGSAEDLRRLLTFEKLRGSLHDFLYSMEAAGIDFMEYQFKPVLKFIESPTERLLIADEVGLGKTIESALIWLELRARRDARRLLVVCPKMLARKWRSELREKFNIAAEVGNFSQIRESLKDFHREGNALRFAWICTYSGLRPSKADVQHLDDVDYTLSDRGQFVREITDLAADVPLFDLVICDEAHYMRNPAAATSKLGTALGGAAGAMLLVSATPVNNTNKDLFTLLRLLDADFFENEKLFHALLEENRPAVQTLNALTASPPQIAAARIHADLLAGSSFVGKSELLGRLRESLATLNAEDASALIAAQEMAERLNIRFLRHTHPSCAGERRSSRFVIPTWSWSN